MYKYLLLFVCVHLSLGSLTADKALLRMEHGSHFNPTAEGELIDVGTSMNNTDIIGNYEEQENARLVIDNPWFRWQALKGLTTEDMMARKDGPRHFPRLFADMGRGGFPPVDILMKWKCWEGVDGETKESFQDIFSDYNITKGELKERLSDWMEERNGTDIASALSAYQEDFNKRMRLLSINFEAAINTLQITVHSFKDIADNDDLTIAQSNAILNSIADVLDRNFVKSVYHLFSGDVMDGRKLARQIQNTPSTTQRPTGKGPRTTTEAVWRGNKKRYSIIKHILRNSADTNEED